MARTFSIGREVVLLLFFGVLAFLGIVIWQQHTINRLRQEQVQLRRDLNFALESARAGATNVSGAGLTQAERLELMQLRYQVRNLNEGIAEAHEAAPKSGVKAVVKDLFRPAPASGPFNFRSEWQAPWQRAMATNRYAQAMQALAVATNEFARFLNLPVAAKMSLAVGRNAEARQFAEDALVLDEKFARGSPENSRGDIVHDANIVLGCLALDEGRVDEAKQRLLNAGKAAGNSNMLNGFGPNMSLARELLAKGGQETVLQYFVLCRKFWTTGGEKLDQWSKDVEAGRDPDFGANLLY